MCRFLITGINLYNEFDLPHDEINPSAFKVNLIQHGPECQVLYKAVPYWMAYAFMWFWDVKCN